MQNVKQCIHAEQARWRVWFWAACELFVLFSMMRSLRIGPLSDALVCLLVGIGVLFPIMGMSLSDIRSPQFLTAAGIQLAEMLASCIAFHFYRKKHKKQPMDFIRERTADQ